MKRTVLLLLATVTFMVMQSQTTTRWGATLGANYNTVHFKQSDIMKVDAGFGPIAGLTGEMNIPGIGFAVDLSLLYSMRTSKLHLGDRKVWSSLGYGNETCMMHYIDIPLTLKLKYNRLNGLEDKFKPMVYFGPVFSIIAGKNLTDVLSYTSVSVMLRAGLGMELCNRWQLSAAYSFSVGNTLRTQLLEENYAKNRCWSLTLSYYFD